MGQDWYPLPTVFNALATSFLSQSAPSSFISIIKDTISGVWPQKITQILVMALNDIRCACVHTRTHTHTHTHILYTCTPYLKTIWIQIFAATCWDKVKGDFLSRDLNFYHVEIAQKNRIIWTVRFNIICRDKWGDFSRRKIVSCEPALNICYKRYVMMNWIKDGEYKEHIFNCHEYEQVDKKLSVIPFPSIHSIALNF